MLYLVISICVLNIIFWIIFLVKFKKLFSTESIIEKTREQLNQLVKDIDKSADRDIYLAEETSKRLKAAVADAEMKMQLFTEASERLRGMIGEADKINKLSNQSNSLFQDFNKIKKSPAMNKKNPVVPKTEPDPDATYSVVASTQGNLFEDENEAVKISLHSQETKITEEGAAFKEIPLLITKVLDDEQPVKQTSSNTYAPPPGYNPNYQKPAEVNVTAKQKEKSPLPVRVKKLLLEGYAVDEIAAKLSCSITEVEFIIEMNNL